MSDFSLTLVLQMLISMNNLNGINFHLHQEQKTCITVKIFNYGNINSRTNRAEEAAVEATL